MIIDIDKFILGERPYWDELEQMTQQLGGKIKGGLSLEEARRYHYLYERASSDLASVATFTADSETRRYLERLVATAYGDIHEARQRIRRPRIWKWLSQTLPRTFRAEISSFWMACGITLVAAFIGGMLLMVDSGAREVLLPYSHLRISPRERVDQEEIQSAQRDHMAGRKAQGTAWYIVHNTRVSFATMAMGISWGIGTIAMLFINGVLLGAVFVDYIAGGEGLFVFAWLLPHGSVEIPAILIAGQAGLVLGRAMIGWGTRDALGERLRKVSPVLVTLCGAISLLLIWAGVLEANLSQYHEPALPYWLKISIGAAQLTALITYLTFAGRPRRGDTA
jgi:uncharacterized membrane protein SpoIIM required for sporulation